MDKITALITQIHATLSSEPAHLGVLYQVQGNLVDGHGERVFHACLNRSMAEQYLGVLRGDHPGKPFRIVVVVTIAE